MAKNTMALNYCGCAMQQNNFELNARKIVQNESYSENLMLNNIKDFFFEKLAERSGPHFYFHEIFVCLDKNGVSAQ